MNYNKQPAKEYPKQLYLHPSKSAELGSESCPTGFFVDGFPCFKGDCILYLRAPSEEPTVPISVHVTCDPKASPETQRALGAAIAGAIEVARIKKSSHANPVGTESGKRIRDVIQRHRHNVTDSKWEDLSPAQQSGWAELEQHFIASLGVASKVREEN